MSEEQKLSEKYTILYVSKDEKTRHDLAEYLREKGHNVRETGSVRNALKRHKKIQRLDIFLVDSRGNTNIEGLVNGLKEQEVKIPILMLLKFPEDEEYTRLKYGGVVGFLDRKAFPEPKSVIQEIREILEYDIDNTSFKMKIIAVAK